MIVPQFWAESRLQHQENGRQVTVRRFGWSDSSQGEAQSNADARGQEALNRILAGEKLPRRDPKIPYNGAAGVPIREEILERHGETIITRNSYGARCLNTPDVLFADIDFADRPSYTFSFAVFGVLIIAAAAVAWLSNSIGMGVTLVVLALLLIGAISNAVYRATKVATGDAEQVARKCIAKYLTVHPDWNLRLYRTPAGMRVIATHRPFSPIEPAVKEFFDAIATDPVYVSMCLNQQCFRARLSAKPWRIGIQTHMRPRPGVWPVAPDRFPVRNSWIAEYEKRAGSYAACSFVESLGSGVTHLLVQDVVELHDELSSATSSLPIA